MMQLKRHPWGVKDGIISKLQNNINILDGNNSLTICESMQEVFLGKAYGVKFKPNMKGWRKTGRKSIIDMDYQEVQIIADAVESGMSTLTAWLLVNDHREVE